MTPTHTSLDAAVTVRKARLAKLASLKRKQPPTDDDGETPRENASNVSKPESASDTTTKHFSLRNYDPETRGPKLGFEAPPIAPDQETLETRATQLASETKTQEEKEAKERAEGKGIDLFELQPRKPNWDLKRDLSRKLDVLQQRTDNAIARIVRARLEGRKTKELGKEQNDRGRDDGLTTDEAASMGIRGVDLVEGIHVREREEQEEREAGRDVADED